MIALVGTVVAVDLAWGLVVGSTGSLAFGLIDEPAHIATCLVALLAVVTLRRFRPWAPFVAAALIASFAIDVDHIPAYLGWHSLTGGVPRPYSHSLLTVAVLLACGWALRGDSRKVALGLAFGVATHLLRDLSTGPGVPLLWPATEAVVVLPYAVFAGVLSLAALIAAARGPSAQTELLRSALSRRRSARRLLSRRASITTAGPGSAQRR